MKIKKGCEVTFTYRLFSGEELMDETLPGQPMIYTHGNGDLVPGLEKAMSGLQEGDIKEIVVPPEDGYGVPQENKILRIPRDRVPKEADIHEGLRVPATSPDGEVHMGIVTGVSDDAITIDFNHELAGRTLRFEIEVLKISQN